MNTRSFIAAASLAGLVLLLAGSPAQAQTASSAQTAVRETLWDDLVPPGWDPMKRFRDARLNALPDSDPRVQEMMLELREAWDKAPVNPRMDGATVRLPGYVVPLEEVKGELQEFLVVPYFGACIHSPPPPANQIVHVAGARAPKGLRTMDAVWVTGVLKAQRLDSVMGVSGYQIQGAQVERYVAPKRP